MDYNFRNTILNIVDNGAKQAQNLIEKFDFLRDFFDLQDEITSYTKDNPKELENKFQEEQDKIFHENDSEFTVTVPFNRSIGETFIYHVEYGQLIVKVVLNQGARKKTYTVEALIPENCNADELSYDIDDDKKVIIFTIPKKKKKEYIPPKITVKKKTKLTDKLSKGKTKKTNIYDRIRKW